MKKLMDKLHIHHHNNHNGSKDPQHDSKDNGKWTDHEATEPSDPSQLIPQFPPHQREISKVLVMHPSLVTPVHGHQVKVRRVLMLYNPESGAHKGRRYAKEATEILSNANIEVHAIILERRNHGEELCKTLDLTPFDVLCIIGGDGTFHECVNGLMKRNDEQGKQVPVAMIAAGTGNSFALELQGDTDIKIALDTVINGIFAPIDVARLVIYGVVEYSSNEQGQVQKEVIYSFNSIHWGLASRVNVRAEEMRWMGNAVRYTTAALLELLHGDKTRAKITFEDLHGNKVEYDEEFCLVIANNIITATKGMKMAPQAKLNDGFLDLLLVRSSKTFDLMTIFAKVYEGTHTELDYVEYAQVKSFSITPYKHANPNEPMLEHDPTVAEELVDVDGELKGSTPFFCEVIPRAINIIL